MLALWVTNTACRLEMIMVFVLLLLFFREGDLRVIRPLAYVREKDLRNFADKVSVQILKLDATYTCVPVDLWCDL